MTAQPGEADAQSRLLRTLAEELKLPLIQIARATELARLSGSAKDLEQTEVLADTALRLLDSYVLSTQTMLGQQTLNLQPVSLGATLYDTAHYLHKLAGLYNCEIELSVTSKSGLVMAHPAALQAAFTSLGYSFINALGEPKERNRIVLTAQRGKHGIIAGIQTDNSVIGGKVLQQAKELYGVAHQPLADLTHSSGAGIMVASSLFEAMATQLKAVKGRSGSGLVVTLLPSQQLALL
jgi:hypothetical protein